MRETQKQIQDHNRIARELERLEHESNLVILGFAVFWVLWALAVVVAVLHYI
jgi:hypothetical protein